ncbi:2-hydroxyacid dehydrogenase [Granulicella sp. WH15]|uniref:2-hydroxyacid dehydrogenase n=1 Tax=Granulicella sp. WH15 TaxID=2602070 RepID=UPI001366C660|nr:2-hydroxyacid dehydrogenase [Granulicella sp. WH15]QHN03970.1 2-hydroxyacid dehydrogenase [Granulicella sp. WH15]
MIRVGVEVSTEESFLGGFTNEVELVRIPDEPASTIDIDFWIAPFSSATARKQWPHLRGVRVVQSLFAGVDALLKILPPEVILCDARGVHDIPTAEWAVTAVLAMQKYLPFYLDLQRKHDWDGKEDAEKIYLMQPGTKAGVNLPALIDEVAESTILIVGYGSIGQAIEARLTAFGPKFLRVARSARPGVEPVDRLDDLLPHADIVVLIMPLTSETHHLFNAERLALMKRGALLVNAGRGATVDTDALLKALEQHHIRAAIDVVDPEPLPTEHPLWNAPNLLLTPHVASDSAHTARRAFELATQQALRFARQEPLQNIVVGEY